MLRQARQRDLIIVSMAIAWTEDSMFFTAAGRQGIHVWRQRVSPTFALNECTGTHDPRRRVPAYFPTVTRKRLGFVAVHTDTNMWSVGIDPRTGKANGVPRRLTRGAGFVSHFTVSRDGNVSRTSPPDRAASSCASRICSAAPMPSSTGKPAPIAGFP